MSENKFAKLFDTPDGQILIMKGFCPMNRPVLNIMFEMPDGSCHHVSVSPADRPGAPATRETVNQAFDEIDEATAIGHRAHIIQGLTTMFAEPAGSA